MRVMHDVKGRERGGSQVYVTMMSLKLHPSVQRYAVYPLVSCPDPFRKGSGHETSLPPSLLNVTMTFQNKLQVPCLLVYGRSG